MRLCEYCKEKEAKFLLKNNKWCCEKTYQKCIGSKISKTLQGRIHTKEHNENIGKGLKGKIPWNKDKTGIFSEETLEKIIVSSTGRKHTEETKKKINYWKDKKLSKEHVEHVSKGKKGKYTGEDNPFYGRHHKKETIEKQRQYMLNGGGAHAFSFVTNETKPEKELKLIVQTMFPNANKLRILTYFVDIAIIEHKIVIEYDGWFYHQNKEADLNRQRKIEKLGWRFIRYKGERKKDVLPSLEQVKQDIEKLIGGKI